MDPEDIIVPDPPPNPNLLPPKPKRSFSDVVAGPKDGISCDRNAKFVVGFARPDGEGKTSAISIDLSSISPNDAMSKEILLEKNRLKSTAIFFVVVDVEKCPPPLGNF